MNETATQNGLPRPRSWATRILVALIELYRNMISPMRLPTCRFTPTCSQYAVEALTNHGLLRGSWLTTVRLLKCGPWHHGGWDPIPEPRMSTQDGRRCSDDRNESHV